ncbi:Laccase-7 protein [Vigna angularis]|uniref:Laccase-7 protein n=1 Tax=Phaseolus angularis TaxID=3914 RepID=A0A8T0JUF4_PHAAN|nr:Laccase-7 protein [Vigna angularis]
MKRVVFWVFALLLASSLAHAAIVEHTFNVEDISVQRLCRQQVITAVNGTLPGPTINAREGEWWNANVVEVEHNATESQEAPIPSDAYTINGLPSDLYNCSQDGNSNISIHFRDVKQIICPYHSAPLIEINANITRGLIIYDGNTSAKPVMPDLPAQFDTEKAHRFYTNITGLAGGPHWVPVPRHVDEHMFITFGIGFTALMKMDLGLGLVAHLPCVE